MFVVRTGLVTLLEKSLEDYINNERLPEEVAVLRRYMTEDRRCICQQAAKHFDLCDGGNLAQTSDVDRVASLFKEQDIKILIIVSMFWSGDKPLIKLLRILGNIPLIYWCYSPDETLPDHMVMPDLYRHSGAVGAMQNCAPLARMNRKFSVVFGTPGNTELDRELNEYAAAYDALFGLEGIRIGQICGRYEEMTGTYIDEFRLLSRFGANVAYITPGRLLKAAEHIPEKTILAYTDTLKNRCVNKGVSQEALYYAARVSLAVERVAEEEGLGIIAINDFDSEMHGIFKTRPQLWVPGLTERSITVAMEGDVNGAVAMWISRRLGKTTPMYTEMFAFDQKRNGVLFGHAGMMDPELAGGNPLALIPDAELCMFNETEGAWLHFKGKSGQVTVNSIFGAKDDYTAAMFTGRAEYSELLDIHPNVFVHLDIPVCDLFKKLMKRGMNQHFSLSYDDIAEKWRKFCEVANLDLFEP
jgi:L-arabinose isomerase